MSSIQVSIDISMYPLSDSFCQPIIEFIDRLETYPDVKVERNSMSTQVFGDYTTVMPLVTDEMLVALEQNPHTIFVLKLLGTDRSKAKIDICE